MISPKDLELVEKLKVNYDKIIVEIDNSITARHGWHPWEEAIIHSEYPVSIRNEIAKRYSNAGWNHVYHLTSSENGERPGLTNFMFSMEDLSSIINIEKYYHITREDVENEIIRKNS